MNFTRDFIFWMSSGLVSDIIIRLVLNSPYTILEHLAIICFGPLCGTLWVIGKICSVLGSLAV